MFATLDAASHSALESAQELHSARDTPRGGMSNM